jgi:hypothetical protein
MPEKKVHIKGLENDFCSVDILVDNKVIIYKHLDLDENPKYSKFLITLGFSPQSSKFRVPIFFENHKKVHSRHQNFGNHYYRNLINSQNMYDL